MISNTVAQVWLNTERQLAQFNAQRTVARRLYKKFGLQDYGLPMPLPASKHQLFLRDEDFFTQLR